MADTQLDTPEEQIPAAVAAPVTSYLLLGPAFSQVVLDIAPGPLIPFSRYFPGNNPCVIFIDARQLGRPLCCRALPSQQVSLDFLLRAIDVHLLEGVRPDIVGGDI